MPPIIRDKEGEEEEGKEDKKEGEKKDKKKKKKEGEEKRENLLKL